jgi:hypothetical protein
LTFGIAAESYTSNRTNFRATKTTALPFYCRDNDGRVCRTDRVTIKGDLVQPLTLTPTSPPSPPNANTAGCTVRSSNPVWHLKRFLTTQTTTRLVVNDIAASNDTTAQSLEIEILNSSNDYTESCVIRYGAVGSWNRCLHDTNIADGQRTIETYVRFNQTDNTLHVNQTWYCNDTDTSGPYASN